MPKETPPKALPPQEFELGSVELEELRRATVIPYEAVIKALIHNKGFVLKAGTNRSTVTQAVKRINDSLREMKAKVSAKLMRTKTGNQYAIVPVPQEKS